MLQFCCAQLGTRFDRRRHGSREDAAGALCRLLLQRRMASSHSGAVVRQIRVAKCEYTRRANVIDGINGIETETRKT